MVVPNLQQSQARTCMRTSGAVGQVSTRLADYLPISHTTCTPKTVAI